MNEITSQTEREISQALDKFVGHDDGRSVAVQCQSPARILLSRNDDIARPAASVMKIPLVMAVYRKAELGLIDIGQTASVQAFPKTRYVSILAAFDPDRQLSIREVCRLALITSDNPLAVFLQSLASFDDVNRLLADLRCDSQMKVGFTEAELGPRNRDNLLTTGACMNLLAALEDNMLYGDVVLGLTNNLRNTRIPARLPETAMVAHKTGSLDGVVNDIGIVRDEGVSYRITFLTDRQADAEQTTNDIAACSAAIYNALVR